MTDTARSQKNKVEDLRRSKILEDSRIFTTSHFCSQEEVDIEDLLGEELYLKIVNAAYQLDTTQGITGESLARSGEPSLRIVKRVEAAVRLRNDLRELDHFSPASFLIQHPGLISGTEADDALSRFEALFIRLNALLPKAM